MGSVRPVSREAKKLEGPQACGKESPFYVPSLLHFLGGLVHRHRPVLRPAANFLSGCPGAQHGAPRLLVDLYLALFLVAFLRDGTFKGVQELIDPERLEQDVTKSFLAG